MMDSQQQHVHHLLQAAETVLAPTTASQQRQQATEFLTKWATDESSWMDYCLLFSNNIVIHNIAIKLLFLTLLHRKCCNNNKVSHKDKCKVLLNVLTQSLLQESEQNHQYSYNGSEQSSYISLLAQNCVALAIRCDDELWNLMSGCQESIIHYHNKNITIHNGKYLSPNVALKVLSVLPTEIDEAPDLSISERQTLIKSCKEDLWGNCVVGCLNRVLQLQLENKSSVDDDIVVLVFKCMEVWIEVCKISLNNLAQSYSNTLQYLVDCLSENSKSYCNGKNDEKVLMHASKALELSFLQNSGEIIMCMDSVSSTQASIAIIRAVKEQGFLIAPYQIVVKNEMNDAAHAVASLASTILTENVEEICSLEEIIGSRELIELLLQIQAHPHQPVAIAALESWLCIQDIPTDERNGDFCAPLFERLLSILAARVAYPEHFISWDEEVELDSQEFNELRNLVGDVLVSSYHLLRINFINILQKAAHDNLNKWNAMECYFFCLNTAAREISARAKCAGSPQTSHDRDATRERLLYLAHQLCQTGVHINASHSCLLSSASKFIGCYSPVWNTCCGANDIAQLLSYLSNAIIVPGVSLSSTKSVSMLLNACSSKLSPSVLTDDTANNNIESNAVMLSLVALVEKSLVLTIEDEGAASIVEGCGRFCVQLKNPGTVRRSLNMIFIPLLKRLEEALKVIQLGENIKSDAIRISIEDLEAAAYSLSRCLLLSTEVFRYCDEVVCDESYQAHHPLADILNILWPLLSGVSNDYTCRKHEAIVTNLSSVYERLISSVPDLMITRVSDIVTAIIGVYEDTHNTSTFSVVSKAVENFGGSSDEYQKSFSGLLQHISFGTFGYVQSKGFVETYQHIADFFDMVRSYLLYCPGALLNCCEFENIFNFAVMAIAECKAERLSTRSSLFFLQQLINWRHLRSAEKIRETLHKNKERISSLLILKGEVLVYYTMNGLVENFPQHLWPVTTDCLFAIVLCSYEENIELALSSWFNSALNNVNINNETKALILEHLFSKVRSKGSDSRPIVKMLLTDFAKISRGQASDDVLLTYSLRK